MYVLFQIVFYVEQEKRLHYIIQKECWALSKAGHCTRMYVHATVRTLYNLISISNNINFLSITFRRKKGRLSLKQKQYTVHISDESTRHSKAISLRFILFSWSKSMISIIQLRLSIIVRRRRTLPTIQIKVKIAIILKKREFLLMEYKCKVAMLSLTMLNVTGLMSQRSKYNTMHRKLGLFQSSPRLYVN